MVPMSFRKGEGIGAPKNYFARALLNCCKKTWVEAALLVVEDGLRQWWANQFGQTGC